ncbi:hypothetical protein [Thiomicrorhabdus lithotrophica]|uniref:Porin n=1 Tax=Thiomicrorhabdus lithotrophica TaxID=2949997 RepID=A0ABY8CEY6_9GAMM|nr:hypothetical protein [Thiomicrorhabdus lithotrophica]WEJ62673.1 hypothetical protein NR989_00075 [Thiomicrorhabdus lithotrophica]
MIKPILNTIICASILPGLVISNNVFALELTGKTGIEALGFFQDAKFPEQHSFYGSVAIEPELYQQIDDNSEIRAKLFYRYDANSTSRTHGDIRELMYYRYADDWEIHAGIGKVFWGTTESRHLVDTINQIDNIESLDDEQRLGQAILQAKFIRDWGTVDLFVLPGFREVDFGQSELRPNLGLSTTSDALYQSSDKDRHIDFAARWNHTLDDLDLGISYFNGTQRTPLLNPVLVNGQPKLQATYVQSQQLGVDAQYIADDLLVKFEGLHRASHKVANTGAFSEYDSNAFVLGGEYTLIGIAETAYDLGLIGEYLYDEWEETTPFQKDWFTGLRWVLNDEQSTEVLFGNIYDLDDGSQIWQLEASRRIAENWKAEVTGRWVTNVDTNNRFLNAYKQDDLVSIKLDYYF